MKEYKKRLNLVRKHLKDKKIKLDAEKLDLLISEELEKPVNEMDARLIDLCLNALVAYRSFISPK